jgi:chromosome segregation ATPase
MDVSKNFDAAATMEAFECMVHGLRSDEKLSAAQQQIRQLKSDNGDLDEKLSAAQQQIDALSAQVSQSSEQAALCTSDAQRESTLAKSLVSEQRDHSRLCDEHDSVKRSLQREGKESQKLQRMLETSERALQGQTKIADELRAKLQHTVAQTEKALRTTQAAQPSMEAKFYQGQLAQLNLQIQEQQGTIQFLRQGRNRQVMRR